MKRIRASIQERAVWTSSIMLRTLRCQMKGTVASKADLVLVIHWCLLWNLSMKIKIKRNYLLWESYLKLFWWTLQQSSELGHKHVSESMLADITTKLTRKKREGISSTSISRLFYWWCVNGSSDNDDFAIGPSLLSTLCLYWRRTYSGWVVGIGTPHEKPDGTSTHSK